MRNASLKLILLATLLAGATAALAEVPFPPPPPPTAPASASEVGNLSL